MKHKLVNDIMMSKWIYIVITILFISLATICFSWNRVRDINCYYKVIDHELFGTYGDFVGGVLGTIFSVLSIIVVVKTFQYQQIVTTKNLDQIETQRFNDLFFELLNVYNGEVKRLSNSFTCFVKSDDGIQSVTEENIEYTEKAFFTQAKLELQENFIIQKSFYKNRKMALNLYMLYYIKNKIKLSGYFRTLYRIYDLIDQSPISGEAKREYLKIIRAQLTEDELFIMRYNAMSYYGFNFIDYINKYHILKHLPAFELLEFKDWWCELDDVERMGVNILADNFSKILRDLIRKGNGYSQNKNFNYMKYSYIIRVTERYEAQVTISINPNYRNYTNEYRAFDKFTPRRIQQLLDCFIKEIFYFTAVR